MSTYYLIAVEGGIEPSLHGPYDTIEERNEDAREIAKGQDPGSDGLFPLDQEDDGHLSIGAYPGGFLASEPESE